MNYIVRTIHYLLTLFYHISYCRKYKLLVHSSLATYLLLPGVPAYDWVAGGTLYMPLSCCSYLQHWWCPAHCGVSSYNILTPAMCHSWRRVVDTRSPCDLHHRTPNSAWLHHPCRRVAAAWRYPRSRWRSRWRRHRRRRSRSSWRRTRCRSIQELFLQVAPAC